MGINSGHAVDANSKAAFGFGLDRDASVRAIGFEYRARRSLFVPVSRCPLFCTLNGRDRARAPCAMGDIFVRVSKPVFVGGRRWGGFMLALTHEALPRNRTWGPGRP